MATGNIPERDKDQQIEEALNSVQQLSAMMQWIEQARMVCDGVRMSADSNPAFAETCERFGILFYNTDWDVRQSAALAYLHELQSEFVSTVCKTVSEVSYA